MHVLARTRHLGVALVFLLLAFPSDAAHLQLEVGPSYMDGWGTAAVFVEGVADARRLGDSRWSWSPDVSLGWIEGRNVSRYRDTRYTTQDDVWLLSAGVRLQHYDADGGGRGWFVSWQPAVTRGRTQALSSPYEFVSTLGWQGRRFSFQIRHISNAGLHNPNRGETMALIGMGFGL